jgi:hypothetical protein
MVTQATTRVRYPYWMSLSVAGVGPQHRDLIMVNVLLRHIVQVYRVPSPLQHPRHGADENITRHVHVSDHLAPPARGNRPQMFGIRGV